VFSVRASARLRSSLVGQEAFGADVAFDAGQAMLEGPFDVVPPGLHLFLGLEFEQAERVGRDVKARLKFVIGLLDVGVLAEVVAVGLLQQPLAEG
jgi:hypothetical protein